MPRSTPPPPRSRRTPLSSRSRRRLRSARNGQACCAGSIVWIRPIGRDDASLAPLAPGAALSLSAGLRLLAGGGERHRRRERLGIDLEMQDRGLPRLLRGREGGKEIRGLLHGRAVAAEGARIGREIRILQAGA